MSSKLFGKRGSYTIPQDERIETTVPKKIVEQPHLPKSSGIFSQLAAMTKPLDTANQWMRQQAMKAALGPIGSLAVDKNLRENAISAASLVPQTAVQSARSMVAGAAGLMGNEGLKEDASKPIQIPGMGEVKGISANPADVEKYDTQTPLETGIQAGGLYLEAGAPGTGKYIEKAAGKVIGKGVEYVGKKLEQSGAVGKAVKLLEPLMSTAEKTAAIKQGRGVAPTLFGGLEINPSSFEKQVAETAAPYIDYSVSHVDNVANLNKGIETEAEALKAQIAGKDPIFNRNQLRKKLMDMEVGPQVASDPVIAKNQELAIDKYLEFLENEKNNISGALEARKKFDSWLLDNYPNLYTSERLSPLKQSFKNIRNGVNDFIAEKLPDVAFKDSLKKQSLLYEARDVLAEKAVKDSGSKIKQFIKAHPTAAKVGKWAAAGAGGAGLLKGSQSLVE